MPDYVEDGPVFLGVQFADAVEDGGEVGTVLPQLAVVVDIGGFLEG